MTYAVAAGGLPSPIIQWYKDGIAIPGATGSSYGIPFVTAADSGYYHAVASNGVPPDAVSATALLYVVLDSAGPVLVYGHVREDGTVALGFDKLIDPLVLNTANIRVYPTGGDPVADNLGVASGVLERSITWVLTLSTPPGTHLNYTVQLLPNAVADLFGNGNLETTLNLGHLVTLFPFDGEWKWIDTNVDAQDWKALGYDDSLWASGPGLLGTEPNLGEGNLTVPGHHIRTPFPAGGSGAPGLTTYLRKKFTLPTSLPLVMGLLLDHVYDDGIVVFLNGIEVRRGNVSTNETYTTPARAHESDIIEINTLPVGALVEGENILAVRVHDSHLTSSDRVWGAQLKATVSFIIDPERPVLLRAYIVDGRMQIDFTGKTFT